MGQTSIPCDSEVRDRLAGDKPADMTWSEYLSVLHSDQDIVVGNESPDDSSTQPISYDDVKNACASAIRAELPVEEMGR